VTKTYKQTWLLAFQKGVCAFVGILYIFHVKIELFGTRKFDQNPDPDGSALVWPLDPDPQREKKLDPDPDCTHRGSTSLVQKTVVFTLPKTSRHSGR
jgi:hypothetical protein